MSLLTNNAIPEKQRVEVVDWCDLYELRRVHSKFSKPKMEAANDLSFWLVWDGHFCFTFDTWTKAARFAVGWGGFLADWFHLESQADSWGYL